MIRLFLRARRGTAVASVALLTALVLSRSSPAGAADDAKRPPASPPPAPAQASPTPTPTVGPPPRILYHHYDATGALAAMTDDAGQVYWRASLRPFGNGTATPLKPPMRYEGQPRETDIGFGGGFYHLGARTYDPIAGRFISPDPLGLESVKRENPQLFNPYAYALNNPYRYEDPSGLEPAASSPDAKETDARKVLNNFLAYADAELGPNPGFFKRLNFWRQGAISLPKIYSDLNEHSENIRNRNGDAVDLDWGLRVGAAGVTLNLTSFYDPNKVFIFQSKQSAYKLLSAFKLGLWNPTDHAMAAVFGTPQLTGDLLEVGDTNIRGVDLVVEYIVNGGNLRDYFDPEQVKQ